MWCFVTCDLIGSSVLTQVIVSPKQHMIKNGLGFMFLSSLKMLPSAELLYNIFFMMLC